MAILPFAVSLATAYLFCAAHGIYFLHPRLVARPLRTLHPGRPPPTVKVHSFDNGLWQTGDAVANRQRWLEFARICPTNAKYYRKPQKNFLFWGKPQNVPSLASSLAPLVDLAGPRLSCPFPCHALHGLDIVLQYPLLSTANTGTDPSCVTPHRTNSTRKGENLRLFPPIVLIILRAALFVGNRHPDRPVSETMILGGTPMQMPMASIVKQTDTRTCRYWPGIC